MRVLDITCMSFTFSIAIFYILSQDVKKDGFAGNGNTPHTMIKEKSFHPMPVVSVSLTVMKGKKGGGVK